MMNKNDDSEKENDKKVNDIIIFLYGWAASFLAVALPILMLGIIKKAYPAFSRAYEDKVSIAAYLLSAFFSGLFTTYRVHRKSVEKDLDISKISKENKSLKDAYQALLPKKKIISILTGLLKSSSQSTPDEISQLIIKKIEEINSDSFMDSTWEGMVHFLETHADFNEFKQPVQREGFEANKKDISLTTYSATSSGVEFN